MIEEGIHYVWRVTVARKLIWKECRGPGSSVRLYLDDLGLQWPRYDTIMSPDNQGVNLKETCPDDVKRMLTIWSKGIFWNIWADRHKSSEWKAGVWMEPTRECWPRMQKHSGRKKHRHTAFSWVANGSMDATEAAADDLGGQMTDVSSVAKKDASITGCFSALRTRKDGWESQVRGRQQQARTSKNKPIQEYIGRDTEHMAKEWICAVHTHNDNTAGHGMFCFSLRLGFFVVLSPAAPLQLHGTLALATWFVGTCDSTSQRPLIGPGCTGARADGGPPNGNESEEENKQEVRHSELVGCTDFGRHHMSRYKGPCLSC